MDRELDTGVGRRTHAVVVVAMLGSAACAGAAESGDDAAPATVEAASPEPESPGPLSEEAQQSLDTALAAAMDRYQVPGAVASVTTPEGTWAAEQGVADLNTGERVSAEMAWPLRSLTKSVVVTVLLQLADEEVLGLDDTIDDYVDGVPDGDEMTLRHLASMTSGVGDYTQSDTFIETLMNEPTRQYTLEDLNDYGLAEGAQFEPGTEHVYSNTSTNLLAVVIEQVTGQSIAEAIDERIIEELDLTDTVYAGSDEDWVIRTPRVTSQLTVR